MPAPLRILTVVMNLGHGGTQRAAQNYSLGYAARGIPVAVLGWQDGGPRAEVLQAAGIPVFVGEEGLSQAMAWGPTLIHIHRWGDTSAEETTLLTGLRRLPQRPKVIETNVFGRVDRTPARHLIDVHLQLSAWCLWRWQRWARGLSDPPIGVVVPYAVEVDAFSPISAVDRSQWRAGHGIPDDAVVYGRIGQPIQWKWHPALFDAFAQVASIQAEAWLLVVGLPVELRWALDALPPDARARVTEIPFLAGDEALRHAYSSMDVFVHAAEIGETFGMVLAEAMLCHTPIVSLSRPMRDNSQLEVVNHGVGGLIAATPAHLADAMLELGTDAPKRKQMGNRGAQSIRDRFSISHITDLLIEICNYTLNSSFKSMLIDKITKSVNIESNIKDSYIDNLLDQSIGLSYKTDILAMNIIHQPFFHTIWKLLKSIRNK